MENELVMAVQVFVFGLVVLARVHLTSHLARKRVWGFGYSMCAGFLFCSLMVWKELYVLAAMDIIVLGLDARGLRNNLREVTSLTREVDSND
jgi:hypothetical protein